VTGAASSRPRLAPFRGRWADAPLLFKTLLVVALPILMLLLTGGSAVVLERQERASDAAVRRANQGRTNVFVVYVALLNADTGVRGYLLTRDKRFLEPFRLAERSAPDAMRRLRESAGTAERTAQIARLGTLIDTRLGQWRQLLDLSDSATGDLSGALRDGKQAMDDVRGTLVEMLAIETRDLTAMSGARDRLLRRNRWIVGASVVGGAGGGILVAWLFIGGVAARVSRLESDARRLADGEFLPPGDEPGEDEIGRLAMALRTAGGLLRDREQALRQAAADIAALNASLHERLAEQAALNRELEAFSYSVSHDLRAPLRAIDGFAQALTEDCASSLDERGRQHLARVRAAAQRMSLLIDDMLTLSRVTRAEMRRVPVHLSALATELAGRYHEQDPSRAVEWRIQPGLRVFGDRALLQTALDNLIGNAWKFTGHAARAVVEVEAHDAAPGQIGFVVRDNGAGFDMRYAANLFGVFQRLHSAAEFPGTGVGLATVQRIVTKHGGRVWAEASPGAGAAFHVVLPGAGGSETAPPAAGAMIDA
jgi:signal transduction histidine kinase